MANPRVIFPLHEFGGMIVPEALKLFDTVLDADSACHYRIWDGGQHSLMLVRHKLSDQSVQVAADLVEEALLGKDYSPEEVAKVVTKVTAAWETDK